MAITITVSETTVQGNKRTQYGTFTGDSSYPTGGTSITPANFNLSTLTYLVIFPAGGYDPYWNKATAKIQMYNTTGGTGSAGAGANTTLILSTNITYSVASVTGLSIPAGGLIIDASIIPGPGTECANATNLSSTTFNFIAIGA